MENSATSFAIARRGLRRAAFVVLSALALAPLRATAQEILPPPISSQVVENQQVISDFGNSGISEMISEGEANATTPSENPETTSFDLPTILNSCPLAADGTGFHAFMPAKNESLVSRPHKPVAFSAPNDFPMLNLNKIQEA